MSNRSLVALMAVLGFGSLGFLLLVVTWGAASAHSWFIALLFGALLYIDCAVGYRFVMGLYAPTDPTKTCPDCAETVLPAANVCKHCGYRFAS